MKSQYPTYRGGNKKDLTNHTKTCYFNLMKYKENAKKQQCNGKNCYDSEVEARKVADEQESFDLKRELRIGVYQCQFCGKWHLTSVK